MIWIDRQEEFDGAMGRVSSEPLLAIDTEADSLHSYFDKVCLIQLSDSSGDLVIDPLARIDLTAFGRILADSGVKKVLHGADYDLRILNRDFGFTTTNLVDTMVCAQLLGYEAFGLAALLEKHFGVKLNKVHQRADWSMRPLPAEMLAYASMDTHYLADLEVKLRGELVALGRWEWALEEFSRLEAIRFRDSSEDEEPWRRMKNIGNLDRRGLAIIRDLHQWRDKLARAADRPAFKIIGNDSLLELAKEKPDNVAALAKLKSVAQYHRGRYGVTMIDIIKRDLEIPEADLPQRNEPRPWIRDKAVENRVNQLKRVRDKIAAELKIDSGVLAPRHVLTAIATTGSMDDIPAMRNWQRTLLREPFMRLLTGQRIQG